VYHEDDFGDRQPLHRPVAYLKLACRAVMIGLSRHWGRPTVLPYKVALSITNRCNSRCRMCLVWRTYVEQPELAERELSAAEWESVFRANGRALFWLAVTGGEPFVRPDLVDIVRGAVRHCPNLLVVSVVTNGFATQKILADAEQIASLSAAVQFYVVVSIDAEAERHDAIRNVAGAYDRAVATLRGLKEMARRFPNLHPRIETTISPLNRDDVAAFVRSDLVRESANSFVFAQESERYGNEGLGMALSAQDWKTVRGPIAELERRTRLRGLESLVQKLYYRLAPRFFARIDRHVLPCYASWASVFVGPLGEVRPCIMFEPIGNLRDSDWQLAPLLEGAAMGGLRRRIAAHRCPNCWTPCEAMQTILQTLPLALARARRDPKRMRGDGR